MTKVVIVDDEIMVLIGIKSSLNWEEHGFEIVGQAENGIEALEVIESTQPDIVLTDLKMPKMDGLQLISEIKKKFPYIKIVVLSCLNEIDYVKKAMKLGAEDYILKLSIEPESLLEVLSRVKQDNAGNQPYKNSQQNGREKELKVNRYVLKEDIYKKMVAGSLAPEGFAKELCSLGIDIKSDHYFVLCCNIDDNLYAPDRSKMDDVYLFKFSFINILEESLSNYFKCDIAEIKDGEYIVLLKCSNATSILSKKMFLDCTKKINNSFKKYLNISISFGVNIFPAEYSKIREAYLKSQAAMKYRFYSGKESVTFCDDSKGFPDKFIIFNNDQENMLLEKLGNFDESAVKAIIENFYNKIEEIGTYEPDAVRKASTEICIILIEFIKKYDRKGDFMSTKFSKDPLDFLRTIETIADIKQWFNEFIRMIFEYIYSQQYEIKRPEIIRLQKYIVENIDENITLDKASRISNISKCYLSSLFKKETGDSFVDYVNKAKMERAKILIQHGLKVYEASEKVGISDVSYFSKLFKKYMGINPSSLQKVGRI